MSKHLNRLNSTNPLDSSSSIFPQNSSPEKGQESSTGAINQYIAQYINKISGNLSI